MRLPLFALAVSAFAIGTTEFVVMGLLPQMAGDLGVSIPSAGLLVSGYALGVVIGGPVLAMATAKLPRKAVLLVLMGIFVLGNVLCALAPNYEMLMVARVIAALAHGSFFGAGAVVARHIAAPGKGAQAIALMFTGLTVANILGVPLGTLLGQALGWRATFWAVVVLGVASLAIIARNVPNLHDLTAPQLRRELRVLGEPQVLLALGMTVFGFGGIFTVFTYIVPILTSEAGLGENAIRMVLVLFGLGATAGGRTAGGLEADAGADHRVAGAVRVLRRLRRGHARARVGGDRCFPDRADRLCRRPRLAGALGAAGQGRPIAGVHPQPECLQSGQRWRRLDRRDPADPRCQLPRSEPGCCRSNGRGIRADRAQSANGTTRRSG